MYTQNKVNTHLMIQTNTLVLKVHIHMYTNYGLTVAYPNVGMAQNQDGTWLQSIIGFTWRFYHRETSSSI